MRLSALLMIPALLSFAFFASSALAQSEYEQYVQDQLEEMCLELQCDSRSNPVDIFTGAAADESSSSHSVTLTAGKAFFIYAVCDQDCEDIDLSLYDPIGSLVVEDTSTEGNPNITAANAEIHIEPTTDGTYRLEVEVYGCSAIACYYRASANVEVF